uniref:NADH dehydrogenase subunit 4L n=1 Tax=Hypoderma sinense TaxID=252399 RepID=UPI0023AA28EC|nr:NADH dehydrogenase subunit 4L [Hypoderma sinense]WCF76321.1 NADH dehydrogenase subunit 4L [Hypoderma sinense]WJJ67912.1 NADH dehydrogenase subunit 4L [Hypoderma sinense]
MMILNWMVSSMLVIMGIFTFVMSRKHLLSMLLSLEYIALSLFLLLFIYLSMLGSLYLVMMFLVFSVCEGALGVSILVSMIRTHGNDYFQSFSILQC